MIFLLLREAINILGCTLEYAARTEAWGRVVLDQLISILQELTSLASCPLRTVVAWT
jgi:hypothetical protein